MNAYAIVGLVLICLIIAAAAEHDVAKTKHRIVNHKRRKDDIQ